MFADTALSKLTRPLQIAWEDVTRGESLRLVWEGQRDFPGYDRCRRVGPARFDEGFNIASKSVAPASVTTRSATGGACGPERF